MFMFDPQAVQTRRQFLGRALRAVSAVPLWSLALGEIGIAQLPPGEPIPVRVGELVHETPADFAPGQAEGVRLPGAGGDGGLVAGPDGGVFTSAPLATEFAASHVGLHWLSEGGAVRFELRTSRDGGRWSGWQRVFLETGKDEAARAETFGALVGARSARLLQYRAILAGGARPALVWRVALTYLDARARGGPGPGPGAASLGSLLAGPADFRAQILPREAWGADESLRFKDDGTEVWPRAYVPAKKVVVHHTATGNDYADGAAEVRAIYTYHAQTLGWGDIGYQLLIDNSGQVYEGRRGREQDPDGGPGREVASRDVVAGHATSFNYGSTSIALIGNFQEAPLPEVMRERLDEGLAFESARHGIDPLGRSDYLLQNEFWRDELPDLLGHRDCTPTECPGDFVWEQLPAVRRAVGERLVLGDRPRVGPVFLEQGRNPWPGPLNFAWRGLPGAEFSTFLEGWFRVPGQDEITERSGYGPGTSLPDWGPWGRGTSAAFDIPPEAHGHYTLHVRTRAGRGVEGLVWARFSALVEPQVPLDDAAAGGLVEASGEWAAGDQPREYYGRGYAYSGPGDGQHVFRWWLPVPRSGRYEVQACWVALPDLATAAPFRIMLDGRVLAEVAVDQTADSFRWRALAELDLPGGRTCEVILTNAADGTVVADAVRLLLV